MISSLDVAPPIASTRGFGSKKGYKTLKRILLEDHKNPNGRTFERSLKIHVNFLALFTYLAPKIQKILSPHTIRYAYNTEP